MQFHSNEEDEPEINLIPLIDVLLMTLIFLIVTTSFSKEAQLRVRLPEASPEVKSEIPTVRVTVDSRGQMFVNNQQLLNSAPDTLRMALARAAGATKDPVVIIDADARSPLGSSVRVMDAARRLGYTHVTFATQQPGKSAGD
jgi:biopolymer transport protein ExbD